LGGRKRGTWEIEKEVRSEGRIARWKKSIKNVGNGERGLLSKTCCYELREKIKYHVLII